MSRHLDKLTTSAVVGTCVLLPSVVACDPLHYPTCDASGASASAVVTSDGTAIDVTITVPGANQVTAGNIQGGGVVQGAAPSAGSAAFRVKPDANATEVSADVIASCADSSLRDSRLGLFIDVPDSLVPNASVPVTLGPE